MEDDGKILSFSNTGFIYAWIFKVWQLLFCRGGAPQSITCRGNPEACERPMQSPTFVHGFALLTNKYPRPNCAHSYTNSVTNSVTHSTERHLLWQPGITQRVNTNTQINQKMALTFTDKLRFLKFEYFIFCISAVSLSHCSRHITSPPSHPSQSLKATQENFLTGKTRWSAAEEDRQEADVTYTEHNRISSDKLTEN